MLSIPVEALENEAALVTSSPLGRNLVAKISIKSFEQLLWLVGQHSPQSIQIAKDGDHVAPAMIEGADCLKLASRYIRMGYSVALNHAEKWDVHIAHQLRELGSEFGCVASASLFLAPKGSATFAAHYDAIDVIAVQLVGSKTWLIGSGDTDLPLINTTLQVDTEMEWGGQYDLQPGDALYVPRGKIHEVRSPDEGYSLHISIGLASRSNSDVVQRAIETATEFDQNLRKSNVASRIGKKSNLYDWNNIDLPVLNKYSLGIAAQAQYAADLSALTQLPGMIEDSLVSLSIDETSKFRRTDNCEISREYIHNGKVGLGFSGLAKGRINTKQPFLMFPSTSLLILEAVRDAEGPFSVSDVPGPFSTSSKLVVLKRLVKEGLLQTVSCDP